MKKITAIVICLIFAASTPVFGDVAPGDVINKANADKIKGMVPDFFLNWVKEGKIVMNIVELNFDRNEFQPPLVKEYFESNKGKYDVDAGGNLVEVASGKKYPVVEGLPFPGLKKDDPNSGIKAMYNQRLRRLSLGGYICNSIAPQWRHDKFQQMVKSDSYTTTMFDTPGSIWARLSVLRAPYKNNGDAILEMYTLDPDDSDQFMSYSASTRKTLRMSATTDGSKDFSGGTTDIYPDDFWAGGTYKVIRDTQYEYVEKRTGLIPFISADPLTSVKTDDGYHVDYNKVKQLKFGYETDSKEMAGWAAANIVWIKAPVIVINWKSKTKNYSYGKSEAWLDADAFTPVFKACNDAKTGSFAKGLYYVSTAFEDENKTDESKMMYPSIMIAYMPAADHATGQIYHGVASQFLDYYIAHMDRSMFSKSGMLKFSR